MRRFFFPLFSLMLWPILLRRTLLIMNGGDRISAFYLMLHLVIARRQFFRQFSRSPNLLRLFLRLGSLD